MFEATLLAARPDPQRHQRLMFSAAVAILATTTVFATLATLERLHIDRLAGPRSTFELVQLSLLPPPPVLDPPPPPPEAAPEAGAAAGLSQPSSPADNLEEDPSIAPTQRPTTIPSIPDGSEHARGSGEGKSTIPGFGCPAGICSGPPTGIGTGGGGTCVGPNCGVATRPAGPPPEVEFSALRCRACADPSMAELRRTASSLRARSGSVRVRFCVDANGRVDKSSVRVTDKFGDPEVDRVVSKTVGGWYFAPMMVAGVARRACSHARFDIRFD